MGEKLPKWLQQGEITVPEKKINLNEIVKKQWVTMILHLFLGGGKKQPQI